MPHRSRAGLAGITRVFATAAALVIGLAGCATQASRRQADLTALQLALPGSYSTSQIAARAAAASTAETPAAARAGSPSHAPLGVTLSIVPVQSANVIGDNVYFVRETAANNDRLVLAESIWTLTIDPRKGIVQQGFLFKDPQRWLDAAEDPSLLVSLLPEDLQSMSGCELAWTRTPTGFEASALSGSCRPGAAAAGLWIERRAQLSGGRLSLTEQHCGPDGVLDTRGAPMTLVLARAGYAANR